MCVSTQACSMANNRARGAWPALWNAMEPSGRYPRVSRSFQECVEFVWYSLQAIHTGVDPRLTNPNYLRDPEFRHNVDMALLRFLREKVFMRRGFLRWGAFVQRARVARVKRIHGYLEIVVFRHCPTLITAIDSIVPFLAREGRAGRRRWIPLSQMVPQ